MRSEELKKGVEPEIRGEKTSFRSWMIILGIAILFLCYGLSMFFMVGDKGPPVWDFGVVQDIPGESVYSTHPGGSEPEPQHISEAPPKAEIDDQKEKP